MYIINIFYFLSIFLFDDFEMINEDINNLLLFPDNPDVTELNSQLESLSIGLNTHTLQLKVEKIRRQKLHTKLMKTRHEAIPNHKILDNLQTAFVQHRDSMEIQRMLF